MKINWYAYHTVLFLPTKIVFIRQNSTKIENRHQVSTIDPYAMHWYSRFASLMAKPPRLSGHTIASGGLLYTFLVSQDGEKMDDHKSCAKTVVSTLIPNYSFVTATACGFDSQPPKQIHRFERKDMQRKMREEMTEKKLAYLYNVEWNRPLGEGGFAAVYLGKDKITGSLGKTYTLEIISGVVTDELLMAASYSH